MKRSVYVAKLNLIVIDIYCKEICVYHYIESSDYKYSICYLEVRKEIYSSMKIFWCISSFALKLFNWNIYLFNWETGISFNIRGKVLYFLVEREFKTGLHLAVWKNAKMSVKFLNNRIWFQRYLIINSMFGLSIHKRTIVFYWIKKINAEKWVCSTHPSI